MPGLKNANSRNALELSAMTGHKRLSMLERCCHPTPAEMASKLDWR